MNQPTKAATNGMSMIPFGLASNFAFAFVHARPRPDAAGARKRPRRCAQITSGFRMAFAS